MKKWDIIILVCLAVCIPKMAGAGNDRPSSLKDLNGTLIQNQESTPNTGTYFSQNDPKKTPNTSTGEDLSTAKNKETPSKTLTKDKNDQERTKKITPFVPSEKIPADQGVDFPYDI